MTVFDRTAPRHRSWRAAGLVAALALVTAGCGTTVNLKKLGAAGATGGGLAVGGGTTASGGTPAAGGPAADSSAAGAAATGLQRTAASAGTVQPGHTQASGANGAVSAASGPVRANAPGITDTKVYVGLFYSSQAAAGDQAIGAGGAAPSYDDRDVANAVIRYANSHGGFAGRQLEPYFYDLNLTTDSSTQYQSACATFTQDHKIFALESQDPALTECAEKAGAVPIGGAASTSQTYAKNPHLLSPDAMTLDRYAAVTVNGLFQAGYFAGKLGLVTWDDPDYRYAVSQGYLPAMNPKGIAPADTAYITVPQTLNALGDMTSAVSNAVTKFHAEGIDHVIVQDGHAGVWAGTGLTLEWMNQAKSQRYYPRYGQNAYNSPGWSVLPADQMDKAVAIDFADYDAKFDQGWHPNAARDLCFKIEADAGYPVRSSNANDEGLAAQACDLIFLLQRGLNSLPMITSDAFVQAVSQFGTAFQPALVYGSKFKGNRDGGGMVRTEDYSAACQCLSYRGVPYYGD